MQRTQQSAGPSRSNGRPANQISEELIQIERSRYRAQLASFTDSVERRQHPARTQRAFARFTEQLAIVVATRVSREEGQA